MYFLVTCVIVLPVSDLLTLHPETTSLGLASKANAAFFSAAGQRVT